MSAKCSTDDAPRTPPTAGVPSTPPAPPRKGAHEKAAEEFWEAMDLDTLGVESTGECEQCGAAVEKAETASHQCPRSVGSQVNRTLFPDEEEPTPALVRQDTQIHPPFYKRKKPTDPRLRLKKNKKE